MLTLRTTAKLESTIIFFPFQLVSTIFRSYESSHPILSVKDLSETLSLLSAQVVSYLCLKESAGVSQHLTDLQDLLVGKSAKNPATCCTVRD